MPLVQLLISDIQYGLHYTKSASEFWRPMALKGFNTIFEDFFLSVPRWILLYEMTSCPYLLHHSLKRQIWFGNYVLEQGTRIMTYHCEMNMVDP